MIIYFISFWETWPLARRLPSSVALNGSSSTSSTFLCNFHIILRAFSQYLRRLTHFCATDEVLLFLWSPRAQQRYQSLQVFPRPVTYAWWWTRCALESSLGRTAAWPLFSELFVNSAGKSCKLLVKLHKSRELPSNLSTFIYLMIFPSRSLKLL